jgi:ribosomal protein S18 acetylase RimI-like enzyme
VLLRFEVSNHRSIMAAVELSMVAVDADRSAARGFERLDEKVLTVAGLAHLARIGVSEVHLYVEADNHAAVRLYEGLGFRHAAADSHVQYLRG